MNINKKCQVFTPEENVSELLDYVGYINNLHNLRVAENSCGDGNILSKIVFRYIQDCKRMDLTNEQIKIGLARDIYAAEIDEEHISNCIAKLNNIAAEFQIYDVEWNIFHGDFLEQDLKMKFDFVIGNPPYISYTEIPEKARDILRNKYSVCSIGKFDYCYAFIQAGILSLKANGKLAYLIPSNIFKNKFAHNLREFMKPNLTDIYDYTRLKLFKDKLTASAIIVYDSAKETDIIEYHNVVNKNTIEISKQFLSEKWNFEQKLNMSNSSSMRKFGDYFKAASSIATLANNIYILSDFKESEGYIYVDGQKIEKTLIKKTVSPRSLNFNKDELIIFPYYYIDGNLQRYTEEGFRERFPYATEYFDKYQNKLSKRKSDRTSKWFEYGRSQALAHLNQPKLLISTLITQRVKVYLLEAETIPSSGLYIIPTSNISLHIAKKILESELFIEYVTQIGVISNGNSIRISPVDINNFMFSSDLL